MLAKYRLAEEYDAAQERGEVGQSGGDYTSLVPDKESPGLVEATVDAILAHSAPLAASWVLAMLG
jgi:hypothetical protein